MHDLFEEIAALDRDGGFAILGGRVDEGIDVVEAGCESSHICLNVQGRIYYGTATRAPMLVYTDGTHQRTRYVRTIALAG